MTKHGKLTGLSPHSLLRASGSSPCRRVEEAWPLDSACCRLPGDRSFSCPLPAARAHLHALAWAQLCLQGQQQHPGLPLQGAALTSHIEVPPWLPRPTCLNPLVPLPCLCCLAALLSAPRTSMRPPLLGFCLVHLVYLAYHQRFSTGPSC